MRCCLLVMSVMLLTGFTRHTSVPIETLAKHTHTQYSHPVHIEPTGKKTLYIDLQSPEVMLTDELRQMKEQAALNGFTVVPTAKLAQTELHVRVIHMGHFPHTLEPRMLLRHYGEQVNGSPMGKMIDSTQQPLVSDSIIHDTNFMSYLNTRSQANIAAAVPAGEVMGAAVIAFAAAAIYDSVKHPNGYLYRQGLFDIEIRDKSSLHPRIHTSRLYSEVRGHNSKVQLRADELLRYELVRQVAAIL